MTVFFVYLVVLYHIKKLHPFLYARVTWKCLDNFDCHSWRREKFCNLMGVSQGCCQICCPGQLPPGGGPSPHMAILFNSCFFFFNRQRPPDKYCLDNECQLISKTQPDIAQTRKTQMLNRLLILITFCHSLWEIGDSHACHGTKIQRAAMEQPFRLQSFVYLPNLSWLSCSSWTFYL